jgi:hypothetical protein
LALEEKYRIAHTSEELERRKKLQEKYKFIHMRARKTILNGVRKTANWLRKHYMNFKGKDSIEQYEYAKHMRTVNIIFYRNFKVCF